MLRALLPQPFDRPPDQRGQIRLQPRGGGATQRHQVVGHHPLQRRLQRGAGGGPAAEPRDQPQPLVAASELGDQELFELSQIAVQVPVDDPQSPDDRRALLVVQGRQGAPRRLAVQGFGGLGDLGNGAEMGEHRHLPGEGGAQAIDGLHPQPRRTVRELPAERLVPGPGGHAQKPEVLAVHLLGLRPVGQPQRGEDAMAHLRRGLAGEGDGDDLLGRLHRGEEPKEAPRQQLGLPGARRRLDDEGACGVQRPLTRQLIGRCGGHASSSPSAPAACSNSRRRQSRSRPQ